MNRALAGLLALFVAAAGAAHAAQRWARDHGPTAAGATSVFASPEALRLLSVGYKNLVADLFWLRAINHFGDGRNHARGYPELEPLMRRALALDPWFVDAYLFAGNALTVNRLAPHAAQELLAEGMRRRPDAWRLYFLYGFNAFFHLGDSATAADVLARGGRLPGASPGMSSLAAHLAAAGGEPAVGLAVLEAYLAEPGESLAAGGEAQLQEYLDLRDALRLEVGLQQVQQAADAFARRAGRPPGSLEELLTAGDLPAMPEEPFGGRWLLDAAGRAATTSESQRVVFDVHNGWSQARQDLRRAREQP